MHPILDDKKRSIIAELAETYLKPHQPDGYQLRVIVDSIQQDDDWYYVVVEPSRNDIRSYDYSARLAEAELDLQEKEKLKVLLVPALPN